MNTTVQYDIGTDVTCSDGACGELRRVVVDPVAAAITHLVVEPRHRHGDGRLVPIAMVASAHGTIELRCTLTEFEALDDAEEVQLLPGARGPWGYDQDAMMSLPYWSLAGGMGSGGMYGLGMGGLGPQSGPQRVITDRVPVGEVDVRRGDRVQASDGQIGRVEGLAIDPADHHVTHILLQEGHLWGRKRVAIPISAVTRLAGEVQLSLTKDEVRDLPEVPLASDE